MLFKNPLLELFKQPQHPPDLQLGVLFGVQEDGSKY